MQVLAQKAREPASQAGEYVARNVHEYPLTTVLTAGLIGCGIGYLLHTSWSSGAQAQTSAPKKKRRRKAAKKAVKKAAKKAALVHSGEP